MTTSVVAVPETITVPVDVAAELLIEGYKYLDVRTQEEFSKGHVEGAMNIPFMLKEETDQVFSHVVVASSCMYYRSYLVKFDLHYGLNSEQLKHTLKSKLSMAPVLGHTCFGGNGMVKNANFVDEVSKQLKQDENVVVGCQSGRRSLMAVTDLIAEGFTGMKDMGGGFAAWVQSGHKTCVD